MTEEEFQYRLVIPMLVLTFHDWFWQVWIRPHGRWVSFYQLSNCFAGHTWPGRHTFSL